MLLSRSNSSGDWHEHSCLDVVRLRPKVQDAKGYYRLLGINSDASDDEVRHAAKRLLLETHPDRGGDDESFIEAVRAYQTLCNPAKRAEYNLCTSEPLASVRTDESVFRIDFARHGRPAWYKEPTMVLDGDEEERVLKWHGMLLEAAHGFRHPMEIKAGMCRCPDGYYEQDGIALIGRNQIPDVRAAKAYVLKKMTERK